jgi:hypothetical protein
MIPPLPDPDSPSEVADPLVGSASAAHCRGSDNESGCSPQYFAGDAAPWMSETS